jgi:uncharacterized protein YkwD
MFYTFVLLASILSNPVTIDIGLPGIPILATSPIQLIGSRPYVESAQVPVPPEEFKDCLELHNQARAAVGVPPLKQSDSLAQSAEAYAQILKKRYGSGPLQLVHSEGLYGSVGENLYAHTNGVTCEGAFQSWVTEEKPLYNPANNVGGNGFEGYGHYTQIVNRRTTMVGCSKQVERYFVW